VPPTRKYDADGGPGMADVLSLLKGSDEPDADQRLFLKAQIVFWLLGATDGHAKNFSIFLRPGARFSLTPLYDIMSAQPAVDAGQLRRTQFKLALAAGDKRHYVIDSIVPRHFVQTAGQSGIPAAVVGQICADLAQRAGPAIDETLATLPDGFPAALAEPVTGGLMSRLRLLQQVAA
jgi:serine/threonine-protein kinase HipA